MALTSMPLAAFLAETIEIKFRSIQPPSYWTTVKDAEWADFPPVLGDATTLSVNPLALTSQEMHSVRLWSGPTDDGTSKETNNVRYTLSDRLISAWVVKVKKGLARQILFAKADLFNLMVAGDNQHRRPGYAGNDAQGLTTFMLKPMTVDYIDVGLAVIWGDWGVEYEFQSPKG